MVITKDLSRLGRDYIMTGHYMERYFPEHRVRYISLLDGIDTGVDSTANDITPFRAIMNDMYAKDISKKIKSVKRDKQRKGQFIGGKPMYGYKMHPTEKNKIVIDEEVAPVVRRIFALALSGISCRKIATTLNEEGVPTPSAYCGWKARNTGPYSGQWSSERISEMLKNETYIGNMVQGRMVKISYKSKKCLRQSPENWVVVEGTHEPIIDPETFQKVQMLVNSRKHTRSRTYDFLLKGLIFCHECGYPMAVINRKNAAGEDRLFFVCRTYQRFTQGWCFVPDHSIKEETVNEAVLAKVREVCQAYLDPERLRPIAEEEVEITRPENTPPPPPPPPAPVVTEVLNVVEDDVELEQQDILSSEDNQQEAQTAVYTPPAVVEEEEESAQQIFTVVEEMPKFPGGDAELLKFIAKSIKYPVIAQENGIQGRVICAFVVNRDGSVVDAEVLRGVDPSLDKEALRVIGTMPKWTPGKQRGKPVRVKYTVPITFRLQ